MKQTGKVMIHGNEYSTVALRIQEFRKKYPDWEISTEVIEANETRVLMQARIYTQDGKCISIAHAEEIRNSSAINRTSALLNCETSAVGRALSFAGFGGSEFVASAEEMISAVMKNQKTNPHESALRACKTMEELAAFWRSKTLTKQDREELQAIKDEIKDSFK